jgi:hypothetical protein
MGSTATIVRDMRRLVKWPCASVSADAQRRPRVGINMLKRLANVGWVVAFAALCVVWIAAVVSASRQPDGASWVCPIAGKCGPAGTPGLGRW